MGHPLPDPPWHVRVLQAVGWTIAGSFAVIGLLVAILLVGGLSLAAATGAFDSWPLVLYGATGGVLIAIVVVVLAADIETGVTTGLLLLGPWVFLALVLLALGGGRPAVGEPLALGFIVSVIGAIAGLTILAFRRARSDGTGGDGAGTS